MTQRPTGMTEGENDMNNWYDMSNMHLSSRLSEDAGAPELRNPMSGAMRSRSLLAKIVKAVRG